MALDFFVMIKCENNEVKPFSKHMIVYISTEKDFSFLYDVENWHKRQCGEWEESFPGPPCTRAHSHTPRMMETPSLSPFNDTAGFHAVLQNTGQAWKSLDIRKYMTATFLIGG